MARKVQRPISAETDRLMRDVCDRIQRRLTWRRAEGREDPEYFLQEFYTAQREFLERKKNLGEERRDKFSLR